MERHDWVAAAYGSLDFRFLSGAEAHYLCIPHSRVFDALQRAYDLLDIGPVAGQRRTGFFGSPLAPRGEVFDTAVQSLVDAIGEIDPGKWKRLPFDVAAQECSERAIAEATLFNLLRAGRGTAVERFTVAAAWGHPDIAILWDKSDDQSKERPIPIGRVLEQLLQTRRADIAYLARIACRNGQTIGKRLAAIAEGTRPNSPIFFSVVNKAGRWQLCPIRSAHIEATLNSRGIARNGGRHYLISALAEPLHPPYLRRALSGHARKLGQAFHLAAGLAPGQVMHELQAALDHVLSVGTGSRRWSVVASANTHPSLVLLSRAAIRPPAIPGINAFANFDRRNAGRGGLTFSLKSAAALAHAQHLREKLLGGREGITPIVATVVALALVDGVADSELLRSVWHDMVAKKGCVLAGVPWVEVGQENGRNRVFSPLPPTLLAFDAFQRSAEATKSFEEAVRQTHHWLRGVAPRILWSEDPVESLTTLCHLSRHLSQFELPPWVTSGEQPELGAASVSLTSLRRLYFRRPLVPEARSIKVRLRVRALRGPIQQLVAYVNKLATPLQQYGEDRARKVRLLKRLDFLDQIFVLALPMSEAVEEYLRAEAQQFPQHGDPIVMGTLGSYLGSLVSALEKRIHCHPMDFTVSDWLEMEAELGQIAKDKGLEFDPSAIRRFARYWRSEGASVPAQLFSGEQGGPLRKPTYSTASFMVWSHEWDRICSIVLSGLPPESLAAEVCRCYLALIREVPTRANEINFLRLIDFDEVSCQISITSSGFASLKGGDRSRGMVSITATTSAALSHLRKRLRTMAMSRQYFFFPGTNPDDPDFARLLHRVSMALRGVTGETAIRRHALRGGAECALLLGHLESFVSAHLQMQETGILPVLPLPIGLEGWRHVVRVAAEARHHPLTAISSYLVIWPILARHYRMSKLAQFWPGELFASWGKIGAGANRVAKSRAEAKGQGAESMWFRVASSVDVAGWTGPVQALGQFTDSAQVTPVAEATHPSPFPKDEHLARLIWSQALASIGATEEAALDITMLKPIKELLNVQDRSDRVGHDVELLLRNKGFEAAQAIAACKDVDVLKIALDAIRSEDRRVRAKGPQLINAIKAVGTVIPQRWQIALLPEIEGLPPGVEPDLRCRRAGITFKAPSRREHQRFRFSVRAGQGLNSPRSEGAATRMLGILLTAAITLGNAGYFGEWKI